MLRRMCVPVMIALSVFVFCFAASSQGGPPPPPISTMAEFGSVGCDSGSVNITGDGLYVDGVGRVECNISLNTGDFRLNLINTKGARQVYFDLSHPVVPPPCAVYPQAPPVPSALSYSGFVNVNRVLDVPIDSANWYPRGAFFTTSVGALRFATQNSGFCSTTVLVQHPDNSTWVVCSAPASVALDLPDHETAVMVQSIKSQALPVGYYQMPFKLTITRL